VIKAAIKKKKSDQGYGPQPFSGCRIKRSEFQNAQRGPWKILEQNFQLDQMNRLGESLQGTVIQNTFDRLKKSQRHN